MEFFIKQWPDRSATLMTANGYALSIFDSAEQAHLACQAWYEAYGHDAGAQNSGNQDPDYSNWLLD